MNPIFIFRGKTMKNNVIAEIQILPIGTPTTSLSHYIKACLEPVMQATGINYRLTDMGTTIHAPMKRILELVLKMHEVPFNMGSKRVVTTINIDDRRDKIITIDDKIKAINIPNN